MSLERIEVCKVQVVQRCMCDLTDTIEKGKEKNN